ncbi:MAG: TonB-dependent receptor [Pseudomonadales bacterium]
MKFQRSKINQAVLSALAASAAGGAGAAPAPIEEIVVTASKRAEPMQDVPITMQAVDQRAMEEAGIETFVDYVKYLPNVNAGGRGPGQNEIYIRGTAVQAINTTIAEANGSAPNVGLYLDEQPVTAGGRNLDVYATDLERIEVLPGPQGTLYGASSMAGTVRLITNKPRFNEFQASFRGSASSTKNGDMSDKVEAVLNLPLIDDKLAVRAALFSDNQGGYIDNVAGSFTPDPTVNPVLPPASGVQFVPAGGSPTAHQFADGSFAVPGQVYPVQYTSTPNSDLVEDDFNDASYQGFRVGAKYAINEDWSVLVTHHQQVLEADGVFDYDPLVGDLKVQRYNRDRLRDEFGQTAWTVEGRVGALELLYTGAYLKREVDQTIDYSNYANTGLYIRGYMCEYNTPGYHGGGGVGYTFDPTLSGDPGVIECSAGDSFAAISNENERWTHEFRIVTDQSKRLHFAGGVFYEDFETRHVGDFNYGNPLWAPVDPQNKASWGPPTTANDRNVRDPRVQFTNDITRPEEQLAVFGELTFDITEDLSLTAGARWYDIEVGFEGFSAFKYGNRPVPNLAGGNNANGIVLEADGNDSDGTSLAPDITGGRDYKTNIGNFQPYEDDDVITKFTANWFATDDVLLYATWSEGYRPPGFNRAVAGSQLVPGTVPSAAATANDGPGGFPDYFIPLIYKSDQLTNTEVGWKATLLDGLLRFNGSVYRIDWESIQVGHIDSQNISFLTIVDNAGDAEITGFEGDLVWAATENLMLYGAFSFNDTEITSLNPAFAFAVTDEGDELPLAPKVQFNLRARYEWPIGEGQAHAQLATKYSDKSWSSIIDVPPRRERQDDYLITDASLGYAVDEWGVELFVNNLTDERAQLHINTLDGSRKITTNRPRTVGLRISYDFDR